MYLLKRQCNTYELLIYKIISYLDEIIEKMLKNLLLKIAKNLFFR